MRKVFINNIGEGGIILKSDFPSFEIGPNAISNGTNFKFKNGLIARQEGWFKRNFNLSSIGTNPNPAFDGFRFYSGTAVNSRGHQGMVFILYKSTVIGTQARIRKLTPSQKQSIPATVKLAFWDGTEDYLLQDISPTGIDVITTLKEPQLFSFLGVVYLNTQSGGPYWYKPWDTILPYPIFNRMKNFRPNFSINVLVSFANHLIGIGSSDTISGAPIERPYEVIWSDIYEDADFEPEWTPLPENESGSLILPDTYGDSFAAVPLGDNLIIYTLTSTFRLYSIGLPLVFGLEKIFPNLGCIGPNCVQEFENNHFVATANGAYIHNGNIIKNISDGRVSRFITAKASKYESIGVFHQILTKEMFLYFSNTTTSLFANEMLIYNYYSDQWSLAECPFVTFIIPGFSFKEAKIWSKMGSNKYQDISSDYETLKRKSGNWTYYYVSQTGPSSIEENNFDDYRRSATSAEIALDPTLDKGKPYETSFERENLDLLTLDQGQKNQGQKDQSVQKYLYEMIIYMKGAGVIYLDVRTSMIPQGLEKSKETRIFSYDLDAVESPPIPPATTPQPRFNELREYKIDLRLTGRYLHYKIYKTDTSELEIKSIQFAYKPRGVR